MTATKAPAGGAWVVMSRTPMTVNVTAVVAVRAPSATIERHLQIGATRIW